MEISEQFFRTRRIIRLFKFSPSSQSIQSTARSHHAYLHLSPPSSAHERRTRRTYGHGRDAENEGYSVFFVLREKRELTPWYSALPASVPVLFQQNGDLFFNEDHQSTSLRPEDIWLLPEGWPLALLPGLRAGSRVVLYVQNWAYLLEELPAGLELPRLPVGYLAVSRPVAWHIRDMTGKTAELLRPGIDSALFHPSSCDLQNRQSATRARIDWMPRKNSALARQIHAITNARLTRKGLALPEWVEIRNKSHAEVADILRNADIFLATGFPEGCPLPPLEAMASGCVVTGFSGFGGWDYMRQPVELRAGRAWGDSPAWLPQTLRNELARDERPGNGLWAADGDVIGASLALDKALALWEEHDEAWNALRNGALDTASLYDLSAQRRELLHLWKRASDESCF